MKTIPVLALGLVAMMGGSLAMADPISPPPRPNPDVQYSVMPGDVPQCLEKDDSPDAPKGKLKQKKVSAKKFSYRDCSKPHIDRKAKK